jgi:hypothetical protein
MPDKRNTLSESYRLNFSRVVECLDDAGLGVLEAILKSERALRVERAQEAGQRARDWFLRISNRRL